MGVTIQNETRVARIATRGTRISWNAARGFRRPKKRMDQGEFKAS